LQDKYQEEMVKQYSEGFNWEDEPIDGQSVYSSGGEKAYGW
jgi:hypothetical protein